MNLITIHTLHFKTEVYDKIKHFCGGKVKKGEFSENYLSLSQSKQIQALACIGIMVHHVTQQITSYGSHPKGPITVFNYIGFLFTGLFFFFSGYGLLYSYRSKENYLDNFLPKRLTAVLLPFWFINLIIVVVQIFYEKEVLSFCGALQKVFGAILVNSNGWFVVEIVILYLLFYCAFLLVKNKDLALGILCAATFLLMGYSFFQGHDPIDAKVHWFRGEWWYNSTICFCYGLLYARFREKIESILKSAYGRMTIIMGILTIIMIITCIYTLDNYGYYRDWVHNGAGYAAITLLVQMIACVIFTTFVLLLNMSITIKSKALDYLGSILLPLFLVHGYVVNDLLHDIVVGDFFRYVIIIGVSIGISAIISPAINYIVKKTQKLLSGNRIAGDTLEAKIFQKNRENTRRKLGIGLAITCAFVFLSAIVITVMHSIVIAKEFNEELIDLQNAKEGDVLKFGRFDTDPHNLGKERLTWIVLKKQGNKMFLLSEYGIAGSYYYQHHKEITWEESDIRKLINSEKFTGIFSDNEKSLIVNSDGDLLSLLTPLEALEYFDCDAAREIAITDTAVRNGVNINTPSKANNWDMKGYRSSWWWLRGVNSTGCITAPIVTVDGTVVIDEKAVNKPGGAIRPVICIEIP